MRVPEEWSSPAASSLDRTRLTGRLAPYFVNTSVHRSDEYYARTGQYDPTAVGKRLNQRRTIAAFTSIERDGAGCAAIPFDAHASHAIPCYPMWCPTHGSLQTGGTQRLLRPSGGQERPTATAQKGAAPGRMTQFLGTHTNRLDAKGRVSIPASFRAALRQRWRRRCPHAASVAQAPLHRRLAGCRVHGTRRIACGIAHLFSDEQEDLAARALRRRLPDSSPTRRAHCSAR